MPTPEIQKAVEATAFLPRDSEPVLQQIDLLVILDTLDEELQTTGSEPASTSSGIRTYLQMYRSLVLDESSVPKLNDALATSIERWLNGQSGSRASDSQRPQPDQAVIAQTDRELRTWRIRTRPADKPVDFDGLLDLVLTDSRTRTEADSVNHPLTALRAELHNHTEEILNEADGAIGALRQTIAAFGQLPAQVLSSSAETTLSREPQFVTEVISSSGASHLTRDLLEADLLVQAAEVDGVVRTLIEREASLILGRYATGLKRTKLQLATSEGLAQVIDERLEIRTDDCQRLADLLRRMKGGSVGISGPRGVGKSTLLRRFYDGRERIGERQLLSVLVSAPVVYDSRDFMLFLFAELCRRAGAIPPPQEPAETPEDGPPPEDRREFVFLVTKFVTVTGLWILLVGLGSLIVAMTSHVNTAIVWGAVVIAGCGLTALVTRPIARLGLTDRGSEFSSSAGVGYRVTEANIVVVFPGLASLGGIFLLVSGLRGIHVSVVAERSVAALIAGLLILILPVAARETFNRHMRGLQRGDRQPFMGPTWPPGGDELVRVASLRLEELRYQQTLTNSFTGTIQLPVVGVGATKERSLARYPMTFPEVVGSLSGFLALASKSRDVLIAIDELDKLPAQDTTATKFLNDLKGAFGVPNTYFLVSVSEDAMSRFERRGLPFRDVFDSTFDEIVRVRPLSLPASQLLLAQRVVGLPYIYSALCHVLSGGVPRDLIRTARRVVEANLRLGSPNELEPIARSLLLDDLEGKIKGVEFDAKAVTESDEELNSFLVWLREFQSLTSTAAGLMSFSWNGTAAELVGRPDEINPGFASSKKLMTLARELGTYGYFLATLVKFLRGDMDEQEVESVAHDPTREPTLELMARARAAFTISAGIALQHIEEFRAATAPLAR